MSAPYKVDLMNTGSELCRAWVTQGRRVICIANGMQGLTVTEMNREVRERGEKIARALALLDRVGDVAADAILKGEAAVVRDDEVPMPRNADQAAGMTFLGHRWLQQHAPDRLTAAGRLDREGE
jgi:hypothetical protein